MIATSPVNDSTRELCIRPSPLYGNDVRCLGSVVPGSRAERFLRAFEREGYRLYRSRDELFADDGERIRVIGRVSELPEGYTDVAR